MRIAAYCRVSTEKDEQLDSLQNQKIFFSEYAQKNGHKLVRLYADEGISGTSLKKRDEFIRLIQDAKLGLFEMVVVKDVSRLARNTVDFLQSIRTLKGLGVNTLFLTANMDSLGESEFVLTLFGAMAQEESANLSKRVKFGKKINAQKGRVPQRIFGYDRIDNFTMSINYGEARIVREIFRLYTEEGLGCRLISIQLNKAGYRTKFDCDWNTRAVRRILANPIYCGHYINNKYEIKDYLTGKQVHIPPEEQFHHERPEWAIVTPEIFERAQQQLSERRAQYDSGEPFKGARYSNKHLFSTLIKCEHCGRSFCRKQYTYVNTRTYWKCTTNDQYTAEKCDNSIKLDEKELLAEIKGYFDSLIQDKYTFVNEILKEVEKYAAVKDRLTDIPDMEAKRRRLAAKKERYQEMYANDVITMAELKKKTAELTDELGELDRSLRLHEQMHVVRQEQDELVKMYIQEIERFLSLESVSNSDLRKIIDHISVNKSGKVTVYFKKMSDIRPPILRQW